MGIADRYRPDHIGLFVASCSVPHTLQVFVDPDRPQAWTEGLGKAVVDRLRAAGFNLVVLIGDERHFVMSLR